MIDYDVIVVGGGPAGILAAMASRTLGAKTLLVEQYGFLGGAATIAGISSFAPFHYADTQVVTGLPQLIVDKLVERGGSLGHMKVEPEYGTGSHVCLFDREIYKLLLFDIMKDFGVDLLLHSSVNNVIIEKQSISAIEIQTKSQPLNIHSSIFIDCTGDADVAAAANLPLAMGRQSDGAMQPMTTMFEFSNVDIDELAAFTVDQRTTDVEWLSSLRSPVHPISKQFNQQFFVVQGFSKLLRANGVDYSRLGRLSLLFMTLLRKGIVSFNSTRVGGKSALSPVSLTLAEIEGREQVEELVEGICKFLPGFQSAYLSWTSVGIGVRESRRVIGQYTLTMDDVVNGHSFPDSIAKGFFPLDIHDPLGKEGYSSGGTWLPLQQPYDIPYRSLLPVQCDNLLVAGRCISASHEALGSLRVSPCCMALGQAAGVAASLAVSEKLHPSKVPIAMIQKEIQHLGGSI